MVALLLALGADPTVRDKVKKVLIKMYPINPILYHRCPSIYLKTVR